MRKNIGFTAGSPGSSQKRHVSHLRCTKSNQFDRRWIGKVGMGSRRCKNGKQLEYNPGNSRQFTFVTQQEPDVAQCSATGKLGPGQLEGGNSCTLQKCEEFHSWGCVFLGRESLTWKCSPKCSGGSINRKRT